MALTNHPLTTPRLTKGYSYTSTPPLGLRVLLQGEVYPYMCDTGGSHIVVTEDSSILGCENELGVLIHHLEGTMILKNIGKYSTNNAASHPRRLKSSIKHVMLHNIHVTIFVKFCILNFNHMAGSLI